jgi:flagellar assembly protein FliH
MSEAFVAGFVARHAAPAERIARALAPATGFTVAAPGAPSQPVHFHPAKPGGPKHFSPADPDRNPTEGWNPLDPSIDEMPGLDPIEAAHAAGYAEGLAAARAETLATQARDQALLAGLADALRDGAQVDREAMASRLRDTVLLMLGRLVGEAGVSPELLAQRIEAATELLADKAEAALLRVHPDDVPLLDGKLPDTLFAAGDATVQRGSFVVESASTVVEDGPELWLDQLAAAIDRVPVPPA